MKHEDVETVKSHNLVNNKRGITLIALVVTIIVLIILALISINAVFGENGLITSARRAEVEHTHGTVWEYMEMEYSNYWAGKVAGEGKNLIEYLQKSYIIGENIGEDKYIINVEKLVGRRMALGNGTDDDIYKLERISLESSSTMDTEEYQVKYYGPSGDRVLGILGDNKKAEKKYSISRNRIRRINKLEIEC